MSSCPSYINCNNSDLSINDLIRKLIKTDINGCPAINIYNTCIQQSISSLKSTGLGTNDDSMGDFPWTNPNNITLSNDSYATVVLGDSDISQYLKATSFGFSIPLSATIKGIKLEIEKSYLPQAEDTSIQDNEVRLVKAGIPGSDDKAQVGILWPIIDDAYSIYGGENDLWGMTWTPAEINNIGFGAAIMALESGVGTSMARIDHIRITVYYEDCI